jgi:hypothetical protein
MSTSELYFVCHIGFTVCSIGYSGGGGEGLYTDRGEGGGSRAVGEDELGVLGVGYVRGIWDILLGVFLLLPLLLP